MKTQNTADSPNLISLDPVSPTLRIEWRIGVSKSVRDLAKPGYGDRFTYYTQLFALFIAAVGVVGVILSIVQTAYAAIANDDDSVQLALEKMDGTLLMLLNATEEMVLALRALQPDGAG
jgi:hypothetical protein